MMFGGQQTIGRSEEKENRTIEASSTLSPIGHILPSPSQSELWIESDLKKER